MDDVLSRVIAYKRGGWRATEEKEYEIVLITKNKLTTYRLNMLFSNIFLPTALLAAQAAAHGAVTSYVIDGVTYPG